MINEALEANMGDITVLNIPLNVEKSITLNQVFGQNGKKRQLIEESINFGGNIVENPSALSHAKAYMRRFVQNKLNPIHVSEIFEQKEITEGDKKGNKHIKRTLLVKHTEPNIYLDEIEVEAMLDTMRDAMQGYNRAKLYARFMTAHMNGMSTQLYHLEGNNLVMENYVYNPMSNEAHKLVERIENYPFDADEIRAILTGKDKK